MRQRYGRDVDETWRNKSGSFPVNKCGDERSTFNCNNTLNYRLIIQCTTLLAVICFSIKNLNSLHLGSQRSPQVVRAPV